MSSLKRKSDVGSADASKKSKTNGSITSFFGHPKAAPSTSSSAGKPGPSANGALPSNNPASRFNKEAWVAKLTAEQKRHLMLEINTMDPSWLALLKDDIVKPEFIALKKFIEAEVRSGQDVFPPSDDVYSWYVDSEVPSLSRERLRTQKLTTHPTGPATHPSTQ